MVKEDKEKIVRYTKHQIHQLLCEKLISKLFYNEKGLEIRQQALFCPYYVKLSGSLGADWGVIVNPSSSMFGKLVFEHDYCGCKNHKGIYGSQTGKDWILEVPKLSSK